MHEAFNAAFIYKTESLSTCKFCLNVKTSWLKQESSDQIFQISRHIIEGFSGYAFKPCPAEHRYTCLCKQ